MVKIKEIREIQKKWSKKWQDSKIFEAEPDSRKKFFGTFPYPYVNSYLHLGHFYSSMRLEALARYKRMRGYNVLYAQSWHATGSPIVNAARRVKENEPKQINILKMQGFSDEQIKKFADPVEWVKYFPKEAQKDFTNMGYSIDWRRQFTTTSLNPHYDKFIRWQFRKLKKKGYVIKGKFPVVWDPVENCPVGDHARLEGEGEVPQEYVLVKHRLGEKWLVSATLRPDTMLGITNLYINPDSELVEARVNGETWVISEKTARELSYQDKKVEIIKKTKGIDYIGKKVEVFGGRQVLVLPASFVNADVGTGIVHSVPSDSSDDLIALWDLQKDEAACKKYNLNIDEVRSIKPIPVIDIPGYSEIPAEDIIKKYNIKSQKDSEKLKKAKEELYKDGYYKGRFNKLYAKGFKKDYSGRAVEKYKDELKKEFIETEYGDVYYQLTGKVVARSLGECIVKIVDDQWFLAYGDKEWKKLAHECLDSMRLYPEKTRAQFNYVLDWLRNWACTREYGLGTRLPWDEKWLIESLSDSTIYMAMYTIFHKLKNIDPELLDDNFFDYVFLNKDVEIKAEKKLADELRQEFNYWYPMDFRNTGKDLIQNHMSFSIFNHVAIFPKKHWPKSYGLNGHVMVNGEKMSKSKGNFITMRHAFEKYGADASRFAALSGGEGIDDANFDTELASSMVQKLKQMLEFSKAYYNKGREEMLSIDKWMDNKISKIIIETTKYYEETLFRSALQSCYFEMQNSLKWYLRRCLNKPNKNVINRLIETQALLMAPITPFIAEEIWESIGKEGFISLAEWPKPKKVFEDHSEILIKNTLEDINSVLALLKIKKPKKITLITAEPWKYLLYDMLKPLIDKTRVFNEIMKDLMKNTELKKHSKEAANIVKRAVKSGIGFVLPLDEEYKILSEAVSFFEAEFSSEIHVVNAGSIQHSDEKAEKARKALPGKVAIVVE